MSFQKVSFATTFGKEAKNNTELGPVCREGVPRWQCSWPETVKFPADCEEALHHGEAVTRCPATTFLTY